jgi:hypothetical protein
VVKATVSVTVTVFSLLLLLIETGLMGTIERPSGDVGTWIVNVVDGWLFGEAVMLGIASPAAVALELAGPDPALGGPWWWWECPEADADIAGTAAADADACMVCVRLTVSTIVDVIITTPGGVEEGLRLEVADEVAGLLVLDSELLELEPAREVAVLDVVDEEADALLGPPEVAAGAGCVLDPTKGKLVDCTNGNELVDWAMTWGDGAEDNDEDEDLVDDADVFAVAFNPPAARNPFEGLGTVELVAVPFAKSREVAATEAALNLEGSTDGMDVNCGLFPGSFGTAGAIPIWAPAEETLVAELRGVEAPNDAEEVVIGMIWVWARLLDVFTRATAEVDGNTIDEDCPGLFPIAGTTPIWPEPEAVALEEAWAFRFEFVEFPKEWLKDGDGSCRNTLW